MVGTNVKRSIEVIETGKVIDFFVPPRKDYLQEGGPGFWRSYDEGKRRSEKQTALTYT